MQGRKACPRLLQGNIQRSFSLCVLLVLSVQTPAPPVLERFNEVCMWEIIAPDAVASTKKMREIEKRLWRV
jgi:hypothetical protein